MKKITKGIIIRNYHTDCVYMQDEQFEHFNFKLNLICIVFYAKKKYKNIYKYKRIFEKFRFFIIKNNIYMKQNNRHILKVWNKWTFIVRKTIIWIYI